MNATSDPEHGTARPASPPPPPGHRAGRPRLAARAGRVRRDLPSIGSPSASRCPRLLFSFSVREPRRAGPRTRAQRLDGVEHRHDQQQPDDDAGKKAGLGPLDAGRFDHGGRADDQEDGDGHQDGRYHQLGHAGSGSAAWRLVPRGSVVCWLWVWAAGGHHAPIPSCWAMTPMRSASRSSGRRPNSSPLRKLSRQLVPGDRVLPGRSVAHLGDDVDQHLALLGAQPGRRHQPRQLVSSTSMSCSPRLGTSTPSTRSLVPTASARTLPASIWSANSLSTETNAATVLANSALSASPPPEKAVGEVQLRGVDAVGPPATMPASRWSVPPLEPPPIGGARRVGLRCVEAGCAGSGAATPAGTTMHLEVLRQPG